MGIAVDLHDCLLSSGHVSISKGRIISLDNEIFKSVCSSCPISSLPPAKWVIGLYRELEGLLIYRSVVV